MRKILAAIVEYKLNKNNLIQLVNKIRDELEQKDIIYPDIFKKRMYELLSDIHPLTQQNILSSKDEELLMDALKEMELLIVDYLTLTPFPAS
jgi:hypothetical protein